MNTYRASDEEPTLYPIKIKDPVPFPPPLWERIFYSLLMFLVYFVGGIIGGVSLNSLWWTLWILPAATTTILLYLFNVLPYTSIEDEWLTRTFLKKLW